MSVCLSVCLPGTQSRPYERPDTQTHVYSESGSPKDGFQNFPNPNPNPLPQERAHKRNTACRSFQLWSRHVWLDSVYLWLTGVSFRGLNGMWHPKILCLIFLSCKRNNFDLFWTDVRISLRLNNMPMNVSCSLHRFNSITVTMLKWWVWYRSMFGVPVKFVYYIVQVPNDWPKWRHWLLG